MISVKTYNKREGIKFFMSFIDALFHYKKDYLTFMLNFSFTYQHTVLHEYIITMLFIMHNKVQTFRFNNFFGSLFYAQSKL